MIDKTKLNQITKLIDSAKKIIIIQAENPDVDSLGSTLALEDIFFQTNKETALYCPVDLPKYTRYLEGWDRVTNEFDFSADLAIIVDTASATLLSKVLDQPPIRQWLETHPSITIDHHIDTEPDLPFESLLIIEEAVSTGEIIFKVAQQKQIKLTNICAKYIMATITSDTLGLSTANVTAETFRIMADLTELGADISQLEQLRHELGKKAPEILSYKGDLIKRIEYHDGGRLATILIPFSEIQEYSDAYNPSVLVLDEMRSVEGVEIAVAFKTYPDGKLTGKIRSNQPIANLLAGYFGGGGHAYAAGFRVYEEYDTILSEVIKQTSKILDNEAL